MNGDIGAGDIGVVITATVSGVPLTSGDVTLIVTSPPRIPNLPSKTASYDMAVVNATTANYTTTGAEFPAPGVYVVQLAAAFGGSPPVSKFSSPPQNLPVY